MSTNSTTAPKALCRRLRLAQRSAMDDLITQCLQQELTYVCSGTVDDCGTLIASTKFCSTVAST
jgi:hypothetical protein